MAHHISSHRRAVAIIHIGAHRVWRGSTWQDVVWNLIAGIPMEHKVTSHGFGAGVHGQPSHLHPPAAQPAPSGPMPSGYPHSGVPLATPYGHSGGFGPAYPSSLPTSAHVSRRPAVKQDSIVRRSPCVRTGCPLHATIVIHTSGRLWHACSGSCTPWPAGIWRTHWRLVADAFALVSWVPRTKLAAMGGLFRL